MIMLFLLSHRPSGGSVVQMLCIVCTVHTVEPLYKGHIGTSEFVHCREVIHYLDVGNVLAL